MTKVEAKEQYFDLIRQAFYRPKPEGYCELHHICPRCLGLLKESENKLVYLTYQEHVLAHYYLALWFDWCEGLTKAFVIMSGKTNIEELSDIQLNELSIIRQKFSVINGLEHKGKHTSGEFKKGKQHPFYNKHFSEEHKRKLAEAQRKEVIQFNDKKEIIGKFYSTREAERKTGINHYCISLCCNGKANTAGGYTWKYA